MKLGRVISSQIETNRDGSGKVLLLQVELSDPDDLQTVEYLQAAGDDYRPPPGTSVVVTDLGKAWKIAIGADDGIEPESAEGEKEIYAHQAGQKKGRLKCNLDGTVQAGAGDDFVAQAGKLHAEIANMLQAGVTAGGPGAANFTAALNYWTGTPPQGAPPGPDIASNNLKSDD